MLLLALIYFYQLTIGAINGNDVQPLETSKIVASNAVEKIVGGELTNIASYPFAVSIQRRYQNHYCGGSYISPRFVLSAAHCMVTRFGYGWIPNKPFGLYAIAGSTYVYFPYWVPKNMVSIDGVFAHENFSFLNLRNDIGLFRLKRPFRTNDNIKFVNLPPSYEKDIHKTYSNLCTVVGWGKHIPGSYEGVGTYLRRVQFPLIPSNECPTVGFQPDVHLCAGVAIGGKDACQGDSGGPLMCDDVQVGIVSWGQGCAKPKLPGIYCRVDLYLNWINSTTIKNIGLKNTCSFSMTCILLLYYVITIRFE